MITYPDSLFGFQLIFFVQGSAVWKAFLPAVFSTCIIFVYMKIMEGRTDEGDDEYRLGGDHPYPMHSYIGFFSFLLTFRLNYGYQRYWEAMTAVHEMISKWLSAATFLTSFHYQSQQFDKIRPPALGINKNTVRNLTREREREKQLTQRETEEQIRHAQEMEREEAERNKRWWHKFNRRYLRRRNGSKRKNNDAKSFITGEIPDKAHDSTRIRIPRTFQEQFAIKDTSPNKQNSSQESAHLQSGLQTSEKEAPPPSLFLQEVVHLLSLLSAVAMSHLRSDIDGADSPLVEYFPGQPMPPVNPDELLPESKKSFDSGSTIVSGLYFLFGLSRSTRHRALYNAARPFPVLGNISDNEVEMLIKAHGGFSKVSLVKMWVTELYSREYLHGSTGNIPGPIISRVTQVLSDGMIGFNQARKITQVPFPFPHAQMTAFFSIAVLFIFPVLYSSFVDNLAFACIMNFVTVLCFLGMHEVARELETPFQNIPNDLPLTTFQAQFNEALVAMYAGFHPDAWWEGEEEDAKEEPANGGGKESKKNA